MKKVICIGILFSLANCGSSAAYVVDDCRLGMWPYRFGRVGSVFMMIFLQAGLIRCTFATRQA